MAKPPTRNYRHITGEVNPLAGESLGFTGGLERDFYILMDGQRSIDSIKAQSNSIRYTTAAGRRTVYTPEALIRFKAETGQRPLLVEVKTREELKSSWGEFRERFAVATGHARENGWLFRIYTETEIRTPYFETIKSLRLHRKHSFPEAEREEVGTLISSQPGITFRQALNELDRSRPGRRADNLSRLYELICNRQIAANLFSPIGYDTVLEPAGAWPEKPWSRIWLRSAARPKPRIRRGY